MADLQRADEWHQARLGKVTASRMADVMAKGRGGSPSVTRQKYLAQLALERLTGRSVEGYQSAAMLWGTDNEQPAIEQYSFVRGEQVEPVGFITHPSIEMSGASPDGLVGPDGLVEVKCPESHTHWATLQGDPIAARYVDQMQWQLECTGRTWCDFVSFDPRFPPLHQLHIQRVHADAERQQALRDGTSNFLNDLEAELHTLREREAAA